MKKAYWAYVIVLTIACVIGLAYLFRAKKAVEQATVVAQPVAVVQPAEPAVVPAPVEPPKVAVAPTPVPTPEPTPPARFYAPLPPAEPKQAVDAKGKPYKGLRVSWQDAERIP